MGMARSTGKLRPPQGWLKLSSSSGAAPDNVTVTFDAAGLTPGDHSGMITFTDVRSGQTQDVTVNIVVNDSSAPQNRLYLPIVIR